MKNRYKNIAAAVARTLGPSISKMKFVAPARGGIGWNVVDHVGVVVAGPFKTHAEAEAASR